MFVTVSPWRSTHRPLLMFSAGSGVILLAAALAIPTLLRSRFVADQVKQPLAYSRELRQYPTSSEPAAIAEDALNKSVARSEAGLSATPSVAADRKIIRTGSLELTVTNLADAAEQVRIMAERMGGYLESAQIGGTKAAPIANITIRIPAMHFEDAKAAIRQLASHVESENSNAQDVTRQYVDLEARLRNLRAEEAQYLTILKSAYKVDDLLSVSQKLSEVRGKIEQQQVEFQTLSKQVETVAITVSLRAMTDAQVFGLNWRPLYQLKIAARDGLDAMADYVNTMTTILFFVPVVLAWTMTILLAMVVGWRLTYWVGRRFFAWPGSTATSGSTPASS